MKVSQKIKAFLENASKSDGFWVTKAKIAFAVALEQRRKQSGLSYKDVAEKMGTSSAYMTKVFSGEANMTIETMVKLARATGGQLHLEVLEQVSDANNWSLDDIRRPNTRRAITNPSKVVYADFAANQNNFYPKGIAA